MRRKSIPSCYVRTKAHATLFHMFLELSVDAKNVGTPLDCCFLFHKIKNYSRLLFINMRIDEQKVCNCQQYIVWGANENQMKAAFRIADQSFTCYSTSRNSSHELLTYFLH
jgi:hypothetical protein